MAKDKQTQMRFSALINGLWCGHRHRSPFAAFDCGWRHRRQSHNAAANIEVEVLKLAGQSLNPTKVFTFDGEEVFTYDGVATFCLAGE